MADEAKKLTEEQIVEMDTISVESPKSGRKVEFTKDLGHCLDEAVSKYGAAVVFSVYLKAAVIGCQGNVRNKLNHCSKEDAEALKNGTKKIKDVKFTFTADQAIEAGTSYVPSLQIVGKPKKVDPFAVIAAKISAGEMDEKELLRLVRAKLAEKA